MHVAPPPRQYLGSGGIASVLPGPGLPMARQARIAARRAFVDTKRCFIDAATPIPGARGDWLRHQIRQSNDPLDLWLLRGAVYDALSGEESSRGEARRRLQRTLDRSFPDGSASGPL
jgi:hypothetical protein